MFRATYRLQLRKNFRLNDAAELTGYLEELGVSHLYLSPILESQPGSSHGYDGVDPTRVSEERGGEAGFEKLAERVQKSRSLEGLILDIVPNHLAASWRNPAWWDVLLRGRESKYWKSFDFRPRREGNERILLPVLGRSRPSLLAARELWIDVDAELGFHIRYWENRFPVSALSYGRIFAALAGSLNPDSGRGRQWRDRLNEFSKSMERARGRKKALESLRRAGLHWITSDPVLERVTRITLKTMPLKVIERVLDEQNYVLENWRTGSRELNYRRFFDINELVALRMEDSSTFRWTHGKILELARKYPAIHGLRIDHIDGLTDPGSYLRKLKSKVPQVWVEKILGEGESLPDWPVTGSTGYEFLGSSARLFVDLPGLLQLQSYYTRHVDRRWERFHDCVYDSKREVIETHFVSEFTDLAHQFYELARRGGKEPAFTEEELKDALRELTSSLRVYRTYFVSEDTDPGRKWLVEAFTEVDSRGRLQSRQALDWLRALFFGAGAWSESSYKRIKRWEQLTGPVMAKGLEDTALYRYFPLLSLNVVGGEPDWVGDGATEFHAFNKEKLVSHPLTMSTTSTHDTKRSEDVRSRIHVISEFSEEWIQLFETWHRINKGLAKSSGSWGLDLRTEYMIYETLVGVWPTGFAKADAELIARLNQYFIKAVREAKSQTSWSEPDPSYEEALMRFIERLVSGRESESRKFLRSFRPFAERCAYFGAFNSLSLLVLKVLSPGLPDFYQGNEMWDLSLVDPDNRRPVDFKLRRDLIRQMKRALKKDPQGYRERVMRQWKSGEIKLWLTYELLRLRKEDPELFLRGDYMAVEVVGEGQRHSVSFIRKWKDRWVLIAVPRFLTSAKTSARKLALQDKELLKTRVQIPNVSDRPRSWKNVLTGRTVPTESAAREVLISDLFDGMPVGILIGRAPKARSQGLA